ncbi:MAG: MipA/OmpV family protein [Thalassotalea sp.]|nr:MipA/OmpV family protein [Thalassotalea sp.]
MLKIKTITLSFLSFILPFTLLAEDSVNKSPRKDEANGFVYGIGLSVNKEIYKGFNTRTMPLPIIGYKGDRLTVYGPFISYKLKSFENTDFVIKLSPRFQGFDESDSYIFQGMAKRKHSLDAGFSVNYNKHNWNASLSTLFDALNNSGGYEIKSSLSRKFNYGPIFIEPSISMSLLDSKHVDYYYGIKSNKINQNRNVYTGNRAINAGVGVSIATPIFFGGFTRVNIEYWQFDSAITKSPLVDNKNSVSAQLLFTKMF